MRSGMSPLSFALAAFLLVLWHPDADAQLSKDSVKLLHLTVASNETDGLRQLLKSARVYGITSKVLGLGRPWEANGKVLTGGGPKVKFLKEEMESHKHSEDLVILFTDGYDVLITGNEDQILEKFFAMKANIVFSAEIFCWPDEDLRSEYPFVLHGYPYLNSGGFIGYAPHIYEILQRNYDGGEFDQLYYSKIFVNYTLRTKHNIKLDTQANLFQNLFAQTDDVKLEFLEDDTILYNIVFNTRPLIIHGNGPSKVDINSLGNYLAKNWIKGKGCTFCHEGKVPLIHKEESEYPTILIGVFIITPTPFLEEMLNKISSLSYPKSQTYIFVYNDVDSQSNLVENWVEQLKGRTYRGVKLVTRDDNLEEVSARNLAMFIGHGEVLVEEWGNHDHLKTQRLY